MSDGKIKQVGSLTALIRAASFVNIRLTGSSFDLAPEAVHLAPADWRHELIASEAECAFRPEHQMLFGGCGFSMSSRTTSGEQYLAIKATYTISYNVDHDHGSQAFRQFLDSIGRPAVYPYFHALCAALTAQAGVQLGPLPVIGLAAIATDH